MIPAIEFRDVSRVYADVRAVDDVSLQIGSGEFFAMLGPSGSGKTTCLRLVAGFETQDNGRILLDGNDVTDLPPYERDVNNRLPGLRAVSAHERAGERCVWPACPQSRASRAAAPRHGNARTRQAGRAGAAPSFAALSGGQRQRVSLARALINRPRVLLLDEPLGALDLKLREEMQIELKNLQRQLGITFVFVTHDQGEALSMADRVAVFNHGKVEQLDTPRTLYTRPTTQFVARFVGSANVAGRELARQLTGVAQPFAVRAEKIRIQPANQPLAPGAIHCDGRLIDVQYHGATSRCHVQFAGGEMFAASVSRQSDLEHTAIGASVTLHWSADDAVPLAGDGG